MPSIHRYLLDTTGFAHIKGLHSRETIQAAADEISQLCQARFPGSRPRKFSFVEYNPELFLSLIVDRSLLTLVSEIMGPYFRLDHAFCINQPHDAGLGENLHGGPGSGNGIHMFANQAGSIYCGQLSVGIPLHDCGGSAAAGGLTYLPGSHRSELPSQGGDVFTLLRESRTLDRLVTPKLLMGDVAVFPETLVHGALAVAAPRRSLYFMFSAGHVCYRGVPFSAPVVAAAVKLGIPNLLQPAFVRECEAFDDSPASRRAVTVLPK